MDQPQVKASRSPWWPAVIVSLLGIAVSIVLEVIHYRAYARPSASSFCTVGEQLDCTSVALSRYSVVLSVPLPVWGMAGFIATAVAAWRRSRWLLPLSAIAAVASIGLLAIELFAIGSVCLFCEAVHILSLVLLIYAWKTRDQASGSWSDRDDLLLAFSPPLGLLLAVALFAKPYWGLFTWRSELPFPHGKTAEGYPWIGAADPSLTIEEFTDYSCPHCKAATNHTLGKLAEHPTKVRLVRRQYPRMDCPRGSKAHCQLARLAYCSEDQGKFWQADRWLFEHATGQHEVDPGALARDLKIDEPRLRACLERDDVYDRAQAESRLALKKRIVGTPYYIVGNKPIKPDALAALLDAL